MALTDFLPNEYGYVALVLVFYCFLNLWMGAQVGMARKRYNVPYPTLYAIESENKDAKRFNCVQRGHQNSLEMMPMYFILMILGGMKHLASALVWVCSTISLDSSTSKATLLEIPWNASPSGNTVSWDCLVSWSAPSHLELVWSVEVKLVFCEVDGSLCLFMNFWSSPCKLSTDLRNNHFKLSKDLCNNLGYCYTFFQVY